MRAVRKLKTKVQFRSVLWGSLRSTREGAVDHNTLEEAIGRIEKLAPNLHREIYSDGLYFLEGNCPLASISVRIVAES